MQEGWIMNFAKALREASTAASEMDAIDIVLQQEAHLPMDIGILLAEAKVVFPNLLENLTVEPFENDGRYFLEELASIIYIGEPYSPESEEDNEDDEEDDDNDEEEEDEEEEDEEEEEEEDEDEEEEDSASEQVTQPPPQTRKRREPEGLQMTDAMRRDQLDRNVRALKPAYGLVRDATLRSLLDLEARPKKADTEEFQPLVHDLKKRRVLADLDNPKFANILETLETLLDELQ
jgi:hypothetical protein